MPEIAENKETHRCVNVNGRMELDRSSFIDNSFGRKMTMKIN